MVPPETSNPSRTRRSVRSTITSLRRNSQDNSPGDILVGTSRSSSPNGDPIPGRKRSGSSAYSHYSERSSCAFRSAPFRSHSDSQTVFVAPGRSLPKNLELDPSYFTLPVPMGSSPPRSPPAARRSRRGSEASTTVIGDGSISSSPPGMRSSARPSSTRKPSTDQVGLGPSPPLRQEGQAEAQTRDRQRVFAGSWTAQLGGGSEVAFRPEDPICPKQKVPTSIPSYLTATKPVPKVNTHIIYSSPLAQSPMRWSASGGESDDDASSRISRSISTLAPSRRGSVAPNVQKLECNLGSVFFNYNKLHIVVCRRKIQELDKAVKNYVASLDEGIQLVASSAGSAVHTSAYDTASKALGFSRQLMSSYFDTIEAQCAEEAQRDQALCMGYQLMEMTMSRFRTVLQTVELEKELADNATVVSEMDISVVATDGHDNDSTSGTPPQAAESKPTIVKKPSIFDRLRKVSLGCIPTLASVSSPLTPVARSSARFPHDPRATLGTLSTKGLSIYTPSLASEMSGWDYMFLSPVTSEGSQSLTIRASLALFPEDVTNRPDLSPVIEQSEEWDVIRNDDGVVTKATLRGLIRLFTDPHEMLKNDMADVIDAFFLFSPIFTTPQNLLELLLAHENDAPPDGLDKFRWKMNHNLTRAYAANLICVWLESHWDNDLEKRVQDDLFKRIGIHTARLSADLNVPIEIPHQLMDSIRRRGSWAEAEKARTEEAVMGDNYFETLFRDNLEQVVSSLTRPSDWSALDITYFHDDGGPELLARQLTIVEAEFFHSFEPRELIKFEDFEIQRKLQAWRAFTEGISLWVQKSVVSHNDVTLRAKAITVFIAAAAVSRVPVVISARVFTKK